MAGLYGPQLSALLDQDQLKATLVNTHCPSGDGEAATARKYWRDWAAINHMQPENLQKGALLQSLPASRQNILRKRCTPCLFDY